MLSEERLVNLVSRLSARVRPSDTLFELHAPEVGVHFLYGKTQRELLESLADILRVMYDMLCSEKDEKLTANARHLRDNLKQELEV